MACDCLGSPGLGFGGLGGGGFPDLMVSASWVRFPVRERGRAWRVRALT